MAILHLPYCFCLYFSATEMNVLQLFNSWKKNHVYTLLLSIFVYHIFPKYFSSMHVQLTLIRLFANAAAIWPPKTCTVMSHR